MKFLLNLFGIAFAGALGYYFEPDLRPYLAGKSPSPAPEVVNVPPAVAEIPVETPAPVIPGPVEIPGPSPVETPAPVEVAPAPVGDSFEPEPTPPPAPVEPAKPMIEPIMPIEPATPDTAGKILTPGIQAMQESIRGGQITEFSYDKVIDWNDAAEETVEGEIYQTGTVTYEAETLLGMKRMQAKAFIKEGKVARWVGLKTGVEIK